MTLILLVIVLTLFLCWKIARRNRNLSPYMIEKFISINQPVPLCGTPDVVWIDHKGRLIVGDYKSRNGQQAYRAEIIQLSVYKLLLQKTQKRVVADFGYLYFSNGKRVKVALLTEKEIINLYYRYLDIINGKSTPKSSTISNYCKFCSHYGKRC